MDPKISVYNEVPIYHHHHLFWKRHFFHAKPRLPIWSPSTHPWILPTQTANQVLSCHHPHSVFKSSYFPLTSPLYHLHLSTGRYPIIHTATLYTIFYIYNLSSPAVCRVSNLCEHMRAVTVVVWEDEPLNRTNWVRAVRYAKISNQELFLRFQTNVADK